MTVYFVPFFFLLLFSCWLVFSHTAMRGRSLPFVRLPKGFHLSVQIVRAEKLLWFFIYECLLLRSFISSIWRLCAFGIAVVTIREHTKWNKIVYVVCKFLSFIRGECEYEPNGGRVWTCVYCLRMRSLWMSLPSSTQAFEEFLHCLLVGRIQQQMRAAIFRSATSTATRWTSYKILLTRHKKKMISLLIQYVQGSWWGKTHAYVHTYMVIGRRNELYAGKLCGMTAI